MGNGESAEKKQLANDIKISWKCLEKCPFETREGQCCAAVQNCLYIFGGVICQLIQDETGRSAVTNYETNELLKFDCDKNNWEIVETSGDIPEGRSGSTLSSVGNKLYLFGGLSENSGWINDFFVFDIKLSKWSKIEDFTGNAPSPRDKLSSSVIGSDIFYFGGFGPHQDPDQLEDIVEEVDDDEYEDLEIQDIQQEQQAANFTWFNDLHKYDTLSKRWIEIQPRAEKPTARAAHSMCTIKSERLIVFGGRDTAGRTNDVWFFDPKTAYWTQVNPTGASPKPRSFHTAISVEDRMVVLGGRSITNEHFQDFHVYDTIQNQWLQPSTVTEVAPPGSGMHSLSVVGNHVILCFGASDIDPITNSCTTYFKDTFSVPVTDILTGGAKVTEQNVAKSDKTVDEDASIPGILGLQQTAKKPTNTIE